MLYTPEELEQLDAAGVPEVKSAEELENKMRLFHAAVNAPDVVCCVCDQFLPIFKSKLVSPSSLPPAFFEKLKKPTGQNGELEMLKYCIRSSRNSITFLISLPTTALDLTSCYCRLAELRNTDYRLPSRCRD